MRLLGLFFVGLWMHAFATVALAEKRVALVIGNSSYQHATALPNPVNDAEAISSMLEGLGFSVIKGINLTDRDFGRVIGQFSRKLNEGADVALFFYGGHGLQLNGKNYLIPTDALLDSEASLDFEAVRLQTVMRLMEQSRRTNLVFLDACRDNPIARNLAKRMGTRSVALGRGLAQVETGVGTMIAYSTQPGNVALDGQGTHSPFAKALLKHSQTPGLEIESLMRKVRQDVIAETNGDQVPWNHSSLTRSFVLNKQAKPAVSIAPAVTPGIAGAATSQFHELALDVAFWQAVQSSKNPLLYREYLKKFPNGQFAVIAKIQLEQFKAQQPKAVAPQTPLVSPASPQSQTKKLALLTPNDAQSLQAGTNAVEPVKPNVLPEEPKVESVEPLPKMDRRTLVREMQKDLQRLGCNPGTADGIWGKKGRRALRNFAKYSKVKLSNYEPSEDALQKLRSKKVGICPINCGSNRQWVNGKCIAKKKRVVKKKATAQATRVSKPTQTAVEEEEAPRSNQREVLSNVIKHVVSGGQKELKPKTTTRKTRKKTSKTASTTTTKKKKTDLLGTLAKNVLKRTKKCKTTDKDCK